MKLTKKLHSLCENNFIKNVSWIFFGNVVHAALKFLLNIWVARKFSTNDYGIINYANSIILLITSVGAFGFEKLIPKMFVFNEEKSGEYLGSTIFTRCTFAAIAIVAIQIIMYGLYPEDTLLRIVVLCESFTVLFTSFNMYVHWFRYKNQADYVAKIRIAAFMGSALWRIVVLLVSDNLIFYVVGVVLENILFALFLWWGYKKGSCYKLKYSLTAAKEMLVKSYPFALSALLITVYAQTDKIMLKSMVDNSAVAIYSVAVNLAGALAMIPSTLIEGFTPEVHRTKKSDEKLYKKRLKQLYAIVFWFSIAYCVFVTIFAKQIIFILYGEKYISAVPALALIVWYSSFSYFGSINSLYMVAENKVIWVQVLTLIGAVLNILLNWFLIPVWGIVGAAFASLCTQFCANFMLLAIIKPLRENFKIIVSGIFLRGVR